MNIVVITQDDNSHLPRTLNFVLSETETKYDYKGAVVLPLSPFGKRRSFWEQAREVRKIFGWRYFLIKGLEYLSNIMKAMWMWDASIRDVLRMHKIPCLDWVKDVNDERFVRWISEQHVDIILSVAANQIFKKPLLQSPRWGCLNVHGGRLPKYRGLMPSFWTLFHGETVGAVTVFKMDEEIDNGPIVLQKTYPVGVNERLTAVIARSKALAADMIIEALDLIAKGQASLQPNPKDQMSYFGFPTQGDVKKFLAGGHRL